MSRHFKQLFAPWLKVKHARKQLERFNNFTKPKTTHLNIHGNLWSRRIQSFATGYRQMMARLASCQEYDKDQITSSSFGRSETTPKEKAVRGVSAVAKLVKSNTHLCRRCVHSGLFKRTTACFYSSRITFVPTSTWFKERCESYSIHQSIWVSCVRIT